MPGIPVDIVQTCELHGMLLYAKILKLLVARKRLTLVYICQVQASKYGQPDAIFTPINKAIFG